MGARQRLHNRYLAKWPAVEEHHAQSDVVIKLVHTAVAAESEQLEAARNRLRLRFLARWPDMRVTTFEEQIEALSNDGIYDYAELLHHGDRSTHRPASSRSTFPP